jgi:hypothetical protein
LTAQPVRQNILHHYLIPNDHDNNHCSRTHPWTMNTDVVLSLCRLTSIPGRRHRGFQLQQSQYKYLHGRPASAVLQQLPTDLGNMQTQ